MLMRATADPGEVLLPPGGRTTWVWGGWTAKRFDVYQALLATTTRAYCWRWGRQRHCPLVAPQTHCPGPRQLAQVQPGPWLTRDRHCPH